MAEGIKLGVESAHLNSAEDPFATEEPEDTTTQSDESDRVDADASTTSEPAKEQATEQTRSMQIPYKFRRDGVQDGRDRVPLFLQADTKDEERAAQRELEDRFGDDISLTDLREAVMKAGLEHLDEVESHLEDWGYGMTFEEQ